MDLINLFTSIVVVGLIVWLLLWALSAAGVPEPFNKVGRVLIIVFAVIWLLKLLVSVTGVNL